MLLGNCQIVADETTNVPVHLKSVTSLQAQVHSQNLVLKPQGERLVIAKSPFRPLNRRSITNFSISVFLLYLAISFFLTNFLSKEY